MGGFVIKIEGLEKTMQRFMPKHYEPQVQKAFDKFGINADREAKQLAPTDEGLLKNSIYHDVVPLGSIVGCSVEYAAYVEFGTRKYAAAYVSTLPEDWKQLAAQAKGKGTGSFEEFVLRITKWVQRKGIGAQITVSGNVSKSKSSLAAQKQAAYLIARKIIVEGIKPQPYLKPAVDMASVQLLKDLNNIKL
mgnify:CR=1 FL=1